GDGVKTAMLVFESLPAGSSIAFGRGQRVLAGEDGRATVPLGPGTHEIEVTDPSGGRRRETVTITDQECGSFKTVPVAQTLGSVAVGAGARHAAGPYTQAAREAAPPAAPAAATPSASKKIAAVVSVIIFAALSAAAFIVIRGPGKPPQQQQAAAGSSPNAPGPADPASQAPGPQATINAVAVNPTPTPTPAPSVNKNSAPPRDETKKESPQSGSKPVEEETPRPGRNPHDNSPVSVPTPAPLPTPLVTRPFEEPDTQGGTCLIVIVTGPAGIPVSGARVAVTDEPSLYQGMTGPNGRWRRCGMIAGHRVTVRVFKGGNLLGSKQDILTTGRNFIGVQAQPGFDPYDDSSRPSRRPGFWPRKP